MRAIFSDYARGAANSLKKVKNLLTIYLPMVVYLYVQDESSGVRYANKEFVKISNGTDAGGTFVPTEAIALRVIDILSSGKPQIAYTYRGVDASKLSPLTRITDGDHFERAFNNAVTGGHFQFIGRV